MLKLKSKEIYTSTGSFETITLKSSSWIVVHDHIKVCGRSSMPHLLRDIGHSIRRKKKAKINGS